MNLFSASPAVLPVSSCHKGVSLSLCRYRKVVSNNCTDGVRERYTAKPQQCPGKPPQGLRILTADGRLTAQQGHNVTFLLHLEEVGSLLHHSPAPPCDLCQEKGVGSATGWCEVSHGQDVAGWSLL